MSINTIIRNLTQILTKTSTSSTVEAERQSADELPLTPGQQVQAEVLAGLPNNRFLVRVVGELFRMELPIPVQPGETLQMSFVGEQPRLTFSLSRSENSSIPVHISDTGKFLNLLARNALRQEQISALPRRDTILNTPPNDTGTLAVQLRDALTLSGTFYESHLLHCFLGERQIRDLLKEPQGKLAVQPKAKPSAKSSDDLTSVESRDMAADLNENDCREAIANDGQPESYESAHPRTLQIIKDQLQTLNSALFAWQGQVWPDQQMEWTVRERESRNGEEFDREWETALTLNLPNLGEVNSTLQLKKDGLHLHMRTDRSSSAASMQLEKETLVQSLAEAGLKLVDMVVESEDTGR